MRVTLAAALGVALAAPAWTQTTWAQTTGTSQPVGTMNGAALTSPAASAAGTSAGNAGTGSANAQDARQLVNDATDAARQIKADPKFAALVHRAKGIFIMPDRVKGAFGIGASGGQGVLLVRENGHWSDPAFLSLGAISLGPQVGGEAGPTAFLLMTEKAVRDFEQANSFSLNANAGLTIVNYSAQGQASAGKGDVIVWSNNGGAFAGADVSATDISANPGEDRAFYGRAVSTRQILGGRVHNAAADKLRQALPG